MALNLEDLFSEPPPKIKLSENNSAPSLQDRSSRPIFEAHFSLNNYETRPTQIAENLCLPELKQESKTETAWRIANEKILALNLPTVQEVSAGKIADSMISDGIAGITTKMPFSNKKKINKAGNKNRKHHSKCRLSAHKMEAALAKNAEDETDFFGEAEAPRPKIKTDDMLEQQIKECEEKLKNKAALMPLRSKSGKEGEDKLKNKSAVMPFNGKSGNPKTKENNRMQAKKRKLPVAKDAVEVLTNGKDSLPLPDRRVSEPHKWPVIQRVANKSIKIKHGHHSATVLKTELKDLMSTEQNSSVDKISPSGSQTIPSILDQIILGSTTLNKNNYSNCQAKPMHNLNRVNTTVASSLNVTSRKETDLLKVRMQNRVSRWPNQPLNCHQINDPKMPIPQEPAKKTIVPGSTENHVDGNRLPKISCDVREEESKEMYKNENSKPPGEGPIKEIMKAHAVDEDSLSSKNNDEMVYDDLFVFFEDQSEPRNIDRNENDRSNQNNVRKKMKIYSEEYSQMPVSNSANESVRNCAIEEKRKEASLLELVGHAPLDMAVDCKDGKTEKRPKRGGRKKKNRKKAQTSQVTAMKKKPEFSYEKKPKVLCKYFKDGKCKMGKECNFLHEGKPERRDLCKYYATDCCLLGDDCIFMHGDFPCKFFHAYSSCMNGDNCKYSHGPLDDETKLLLHQATSRDEAKDSERKNQESAIKTDANHETESEQQSRLNEEGESLPSLYQPLQ